VNYLSDRERRQSVRFPQVLDVHARCLLPAGAPGNVSKEFDGRIHNLSNGGVCILSSFPLQPSMFICCNFPIADAPVAVPTFMQVRWSVKQGQKSPNYISGLQFVA
jgi:PilZ domain